MQLRQWQHLMMTNKDSIGFANSECTALIKDGMGATVILDTGASSHMTSHKELLKNFSSVPSPRKIRAVDKETFDALGVGQMVVTTKFNGKPVKITLKDTLYAPQITFTLISIGRCDDAGYHAEFVHNKCIIKNLKVEFFYKHLNFIACIE